MTRTQFFPRAQVSTEFVVIIGIFLIVMTVIFGTFSDRVIFLKQKQIQNEISQVADEIAAGINQVSFLGNGTIKIVRVSDILYAGNISVSVYNSSATVSTRYRDFEYSATLATSRFNSSNVTYSNIRLTNDEGKILIEDFE
ncbi:MAG: hypothetical protein ACI8Y7_000121 [Candidatus Woesearchaeota archaeon]|jgi:hypothetical protein